MLQSVLKKENEVSELIGYLEPRKEITVKYKTLVIAATILTLSASSAFAADLTLSIQDVRNSKGRMLVAIFNEESAFSTLNADEAYAVFSLVAKEGKQEITLHDLPAGDYAVSLHHDENGNGQFDLNKHKFPLEGFGYSNNVGADKQVTPFSEASFTHRNADTVQTIKLVYIK